MPVYNKLTSPINLTETFEEHFDGRSWTTIQDQIDAGFPYYIQPTPEFGTYEEVIDFGAEFNNVIINVRWATSIGFGSVTVSCEVSSSLDDITYDTPISGVSVFYSAIRYLKLKLTFQADGAGPDFHDFIHLFALQVSLDVKREIDSGEVVCLAADSGGTDVVFNKSFKDVDSITLTPSGTVPRYAIYDFSDIPNPTGFKIIVYNSAGARVDATVSWKVRGII